MKANTSKKTPVRRGAPRLAILLAFLLTATMIALVIRQGLLRPESSTQSGAIPFVQSTQQVTPGQALTVSAGPVSVFIPQGATTQPGTIAIIPREANLFPTAGDTVWTRPQIVNIEFHDPQGNTYPAVTFAQPAEICFQLSQAQWKDYSTRPDAYQVHYYAEDQNPAHWVILPLINRAEKLQVCGQTDHLSLFALAVKAKVGVPITGATPFPTPGLYVAP
jgi:hypothetical protein